MPVSALNIDETRERDARNRARFSIQAEGRRWALLASPIKPRDVQTGKGAWLAFVACAV